MNSMSYLVLARKYRPRSFEALVGQEHVVQALANALDSKRLHHAYLFTGTRGVGKTTVSRILAKSLNCTGADGAGGITAKPCGVCDACRDIDAGRFVDYVELDAASNRGVEEITQLLDQSVYKPVVGRFKVYMIDEVHMLSNHAFNAMLKTLEEPPEYLKFVLATTDPQKVPPTVLSRCLQFNLRPMAPQTVQEHLARVLEAEQIEAEGGALRLIARAAHGSMRDALSLTDQAIAYGAGRLEEGGVRQMLGAVDRGHALRIVEALAAGEGAALVAAVDALRGLGLSAGGLLEELAAMLQQMAVVQAVPQAQDADDPDTPTLVRLAGALAPDETQLYYSIALHGREELGLAPDEYSGLVMVLLRMHAFRPAGAGARSVPQPTPAPAATPAARAATVAATSLAAVAVPPAAERIVMAPPAAPVEQAPSAASISATADPHADRWTAVVAQLNERGAISAMVRELAMQAQCLGVETADQLEVWRLRVERESLRAPAQRDRLQSALAALSGRPTQIEIEVGVAVDSPALRDAALRAQRQAAAEQIIANDPLVQSLMQQYKTARIVPGSVKPTVQ
jgi:DNA polymerase-3 subunit gamma/tau